MIAEEWSGICFVDTEPFELERLIVSDEEDDGDEISLPFIEDA